MNNRDTAPLTQQRVDHLLQEIAIGSKPGVTLVQDANGAWGKAGETYLTLRFYDPNEQKDLITATFVLASISSYAADEEQRELNAEDK